MATRSVNEGFDDFLPRITPTSGHSASVDNHRKSTKSCLETNFNLLRFFDVGSFGNGTSIRGFSDVDYIASIPDAKLNNDSGKALVQVRDVLDRRFPNTGVRVNCPAIKLPFGTDAKETTEVVPAVYQGKTGADYSVYLIPNCEGKWVKSSPEAHNAYVSEVNKKLGYKVKPLIRFIKAWKYLKSVPISSFYLELRIAKWAQSEGSILYDMDVRSILSHLSSVGLASIQDPVEVSGYVRACKTDIQLADAKSKLATALARAEKAREASRQERESEAFAWWDLVFDGKFPSYYK